MTLHDQIDLIDELIYTCPETTIRQYLIIEHYMDMKTRGGIRNITSEQKQLILQLAKEREPPKAIAAIIGVHQTVVYKVCQKLGGSIREIQHPGIIAKRGPVPVEIKEATVDVKEKRGNKPLVRPPAIYSNHSPYGIATELHNPKKA